jgi:hypothetical protein
MTQSKQKGLLTPALVNKVCKNGHNGEAIRRRPEIEGKRHITSLSGTMARSLLGLASLAWLTGVIRWALCRLAAGYRLNTVEWDEHRLSKMIAGGRLVSDEKGSEFNIFPVACKNTRKSRFYLWLCSIGYPPLDSGSPACFWGTAQ